MVLKNLFKDTAIYGGGDLFARLIAFFLFPIYAHQLTPEEFGTLELILVTITLVALLANTGMNNAVQRYYWDKDTREQEQALIVTSGLFFLVLATLLVAMLILAMLLLKETFFTSLFSTSFYALIIAVLIIGPQQWSRYLGDAIRLQFKPWKYVIVSFISKALGPLLGALVLLTTDLGVEAVLVATLLALIIACIVALPMVRKDLCLAVDSRWLYRLVQFGYPFIFAGLAYWLFGSMDRWMLTVLSSIQETGIYSVAYKYAMIPMFMVFAFGQAWSPYAIKLQREHPHNYKKIYARVLTLLSWGSIILCGAVMLNAGELLGLMVPENYWSGVSSIVWLTLGIAFNATTQVTAIGISLKKKTILLARLAWLAAIVNLISNYLLIPLYGGEGAAFSTMLAYLVLTISYMFFSQRLHPIPLDKIQLGLASLAMLMVTFFSLRFVEFELFSHAMMVKFCLFLTIMVIVIYQIRSPKNNIIVSSK